MVKGGAQDFPENQKFDNIFFDPKFYFKVCIPDESWNQPV